MSSRVTTADNPDSTPNLRGPETQEEEDQAKKERKADEHRQQASEERNLSAPTVYEIIAAEGVEEMERPLNSLWWSGVAAGLGISLSLYVMAALRSSLGDTPGAGVIEKFGYCFGFLVVILGRLQLFTENTITPILPALRQREQGMLRCVARLWAVVLVANLVGTFLAALIPTIFPIGTPELMKAMIEISNHFSERAYAHTFFSAIPAGFMVAALVWMLPGSKGFEIWTIVVMTFAIGITDTSHVVVGSAELFTSILSGDSGIGEALMRLLLAGLGNVVGGTGLFAVLAYAQVSEEI